MHVWILLCERNCPWSGSGYSEKADWRQKIKFFQVVGIFLPPKFLFLLFWIYKPSDRRGPTKRPSFLVLTVSRMRCNFLYDLRHDPLHVSHLRAHNEAARIPTRQLYTLSHLCPFSPINFLLPAGGLFTIICNWRLFFWWSSPKILQRIDLPNI